MLAFEDSKEKLFISRFPFVSSSSEWFRKENDGFSCYLRYMISQDNDKEIRNKTGIDITILFLKLVLVIIFVNTISSLTRQILTDSECAGRMSIGKTLDKLIAIKEWRSQWYHCLLLSLRRVLSAMLFVLKHWINLLLFPCKLLSNLLCRAHKWPLTVHVI